MLNIFLTAMVLIAAALRRTIQLPHPFPLVAVALLHPLHAQAQIEAYASSSNTVRTLSEVIVTAPSQVDFEPLTQSPSGVGVVTIVDAKEIAARPSARIEDILQDAGLASASASSSFGLMPSIGIRGFSVAAQSATPSLVSSKILVNGVPDIASSFTRDMSSVERIEVMGGYDSTMVGAGAPGGTLQYQTKRPRGTEFVTTDVTIASDGLKRMVLDAEKDIQALKVRLVAASQRGQTTAEGIGTDRDNVLLASSLETPAGRFRLDIEQNNDEAAYVFGTFYQNNQFWYDKPYVSPQSSAARRSSRTALYWDYVLSDDTFVRAWAQQSDVSRDEALVGFWSLKNATTLAGYYRLLASAYQQQDIGVSLDRHLQAWGVSHSFSLLAQQQKQDLHFNGPQSINQYSISIQSPAWPVDLSTLTLTPRTFQQSVTEQGLAVGDSINFTDTLQLRLGTRLSGITISTASNTPKATTTADLRHETSSAGLSWQLTPQDKFWISRAESFQPVQGQTRDGGYLPPQVATQWEWGIQRQTPDNLLTFSMFHIQQDNLPAVDPLNKNYLIPLGGMRSFGLTVTEKTTLLGLPVQANVTAQNATITTPVSSGQGSILPGVPRLVGAVKISSPQRQLGFDGWVRGIVSSEKPADSHGSVYAPGYLRWDTGTTYKEAKWQLSAWVQNLFDLRYVQALNAADNVWQGSRRSVWLNLNYQY
jgi:iron complex outermembrane recepter protein